MYEKIVVPFLVVLKTSDKVCSRGSNFAFRKQGVGSIFFNNLNTIDYAVAQCTNETESGERIFYYNRVSRKVC